MVRVITQETYDEVVKENIDEFDMTPEEAIKEAVAQFEAQVFFRNYFFTLINTSWRYAKVNLGQRVILGAWDSRLFMSILSSRIKSG